MSTLPAVITNPQEAISSLVEMALATCVSPHTRRAYGTSIRAFVNSGQPLNREGVALYIQRMREEGKEPSTLGAALSGIRKLAQEAQVRGLITHDQFAQIEGISAGRVQRSRTGQWLTVAQVKRFLSLPDRSTYWGKRDAVILSILLGTGIRRAELARLSWEQYAEREGRPCLIDIKGKGNKLRSVPVPMWAVPDIEAWKEASLQPPPAPRAHMQKMWDTQYAKYRSGKIAGGIQENRIWSLVQSYGEQMGVKLAPHDLRRTLAQLLRKAGAPLEQIQFTLGHADVATTVIYLGASMQFGKGEAAVDLLDFTPSIKQHSPGYCDLPPKHQDMIECVLESERMAIRLDKQDRAQEAQDAR